MRLCLCLVFFLGGGGGGGGGCSFFFQNQLFRNIQEYRQCQKVWTQIGPDLDRNCLQRSPLVSQDS